MERHARALDSFTEKDTYMNMVPWVNAYLKLRHKLVAEGTENIPDGAAMFVANHLAFDDSLAIAAVYANLKQKPLRLGAKSEYFEGKGIDNKGLMGKPIKKFVVDTQQIPVYRESNSRGTVDFSKEVKKRFQKDEALLLHAEGTRSPDGKLHKFKYGAASLAIKNSVPIVPVSITYPKRHFPLRDIALVQFGEPLLPADYGMEFTHYPLIPDALVDAAAPRLMNQRERVAAVTDILEARVAEMSGQERSPEYANPYNKDVA